MKMGIFRKAQAFIAQLSSEPNGHELTRFVLV